MNRRREQPEAALQRAVFQHVQARSARGAFVFHCANGGWRSSIEAKILKGLGVVPGVPDLIAIACGGRAHFLELKAPGGRLSKAQRETIAQLEAAGAIVEIANTLDDALGHLERWGVLRGKVQGKVQ